MKLTRSIFTLLFVDFCLSQGWYFPGQFNLADFETTTQSDRKLSSPNRKRISERKCEEYKDLVAITTHFTSLSLWQKRTPVDALKEYECNPFVGLIAGGEKTRVGEFPHMAAIGFRDEDGGIRFSCGGSLISENFILTVAHCFQDSDGLKPSIVRLGDQNLARSDDGAKPVEYQIKSFIRHPDYHHFTRENDIALILLDKTVAFVTNMIRPACLSQDKDYTETVIATGWGQTGTYKKPSDDLMKVSLKIVDQVTCFSEIGDNLSSSQLYPTQICAGGTRGKDTCNGDSGGPIQIAHSDATCVFDIIGVTSYGLFLCGTNTPAIYTRVNPYLDWIEKIVWNTTST